MWVYTQARKSDGQLFLLDLSHLGLISVEGPEMHDGEQIWNITAASGDVTWVLAYANSLAEAVSIQRRIFNSLATGERAINLNGGRKTSYE